MQDKKCSLKEHEEINAIKYCQECRINMCNKCLEFHSKLFKDHHQYNLNNPFDDIFTGICKNKNHTILEYYCENHNQLCCAACIAKIKEQGNGEHNECTVTNIKIYKMQNKVY